MAQREDRVVPEEEEENDDCLERRGRTEGGLENNLEWEGAGRWGGKVGGRKENGNVDKEDIGARVGGRSSWFFFSSSSSSSSNQACSGYEPESDESCWV